MKNVIKSRYEELSKGEQMYAKITVPMFICWTVYMMLGIPVLMP